MGKVMMQYDVEEKYAAAVAAYVEEAVRNLVRAERVRALLAEHDAEIEAAVVDALTVSEVALGEEELG